MANTRRLQQVEGGEPVPDPRPPVGSVPGTLVENPNAEPTVISVFEANSPTRNATRTTTPTRPPPTPAAVLKMMT